MTFVLSLQKCRLPKNIFTPLKTPQVHTRKKNTRHKKMKYRIGKSLYTTTLPHVILSLVSQINRGYLLFSQFF